MNLVMCPSGFRQVNDQPASIVEAPAQRPMTCCVRNRKNSANNAGYKEREKELAWTNPGSNPGGKLYISHTHRAKKTRHAEQQKRQAKSRHAVPEPRPSTSYRLNDKTG
jgi:hypothetical protein